MLPCSKQAGTLTLAVGLETPAPPYYEVYSICIVICTLQVLPFMTRTNSRPYINRLTNDKATTFPELYAGGRYITIIALFNYISAFLEMCYVNTS